MEGREFDLLLIRHIPWRMDGSIHKLRYNSASDLLMFAEASALHWKDKDCPYNWNTDRWLDQDSLRCRERTHKIHQKMVWVDDTNCLMTKIIPCDSYATGVERLLHYIPTADTVLSPINLVKVLRLCDHKRIPQLVPDPTTNSLQQTHLRTPAEKTDFPA